MRVFIVVQDVLHFAFVGALQNTLHGFVIRLTFGHLPVQVISTDCQESWKPFHLAAQHLISTEGNAQIPLPLVGDSRCDCRRCSWDGDPVISSRKVGR